MGGPRTPVGQVQSLGGRTLSVRSVTATLASGIACSSVARRLAATSTRSPTSRRSSRPTRSTWARAPSSASSSSPPQTSASPQRAIRPFMPSTLSPSARGSGCVCSPYCCGQTAMSGPRTHARPATSSTWPQRRWPRPPPGTRLTLQSSSQICSGPRCRVCRAPARKLSPPMSVRSCRGSRRLAGTACSLRMACSSSRATSPLTARRGACSSRPGCALSSSRSGATDACRFEVWRGRTLEGYCFP
mmetsp:Transcript_39528/g.104336  ORF Transcript_39528/g.104336 Transcript_39528/m.104336 type:complete len:245 (+) Transcript_39528:765-1499(+)